MLPGAEKGPYGLYKTPEDPFIGRQTQKAISLGPCNAGDVVLRGTFLMFTEYSISWCEILVLREYCDYNKIV